MGTVLESARSLTNDDQRGEESERQTFGDSNELVFLLRLCVNFALPDIAAQVYFVTYAQKTREQ